MEGRYSWDVGPPTSSRSATDSSRNFWDAVMGNKKPDRASIFLKNYLEANFKVNTADLTTEEISQRKLRAAVFYWMAGASGDVCPFFAGGHALGAAFNQLVRSRAQLLLLE